MTQPTGDTLLPLPISPADALTKIIKPALALLPPHMGSHDATVLLLAIAGQESNLAHRFQVVAGKPGARGPARGLWQFERAGGTAGVLRHESTAVVAKAICGVLDVPADAKSVWEAFEHNDILACVFARLLLWTDPRPIPPIFDIEGMWDCYVRNWRPGKPHRDRWDRHYKNAAEAVHP